MLDSDVLVDLARKHAAALEWFYTLAAMPYVAGFASLELLHGCRNAAELRAAQTFLRPFPIVWPTEEDLQRCLRDYAPLRLSDGLGLIDSLIATTDVGRGAVVMDGCASAGRDARRLRQRLFL